MAQQLKTEALVIQNIRWSESSKIVHLFTEGKGYVKAIARGAMRPRSPFRGLLENLNYIEVVLSLKEGRGLQIISQATLLDGFGNVREDLNATAVGYAILELIKATIHYNEAARPLFRYTVELLESLNKFHPPRPLYYLLHFLFRLSDYLGFGWNLSACRICQKRPHKFPVVVDLENGAIICPDCLPENFIPGSPLTKERWMFLRTLHSVPPLELGALERLVPADLNYQSLLDVLLAHLNYHTDQTVQLKSLKMYSL